MTVILNLASTKDKYAFVNKGVSAVEVDSIHIRYGLNQTRFYPHWIASILA